ncbi:MAG: c-type cytochrome [Limnohabitans sp.]|nr:c-type cytochrome [Limnohabitans sp.]
MPSSLRNRVNLSVALHATLISFLSAPLCAQNGDRAGETQGELPAEWRVTEAPVRSATDELATFDILDGYKIELVAAEPLVEAPVALEFGPDGRLWVVEMRGYMRDADGAGEDQPLGRVKVLEDTNGDGTMDRAEIFLDGLVMPRGIALWRDGVLVIEPPHLLFVQDTNGDGRADTSRIMASGFAGQGNPEHAGNGLLWTLDNTFTCSQHPVRFIPEGDALREERVAPHGQWGISEDDEGRLYYSPNSDPLLVDLVPKQYAALNTSQKSFDGVPARAASDMRVFPSHLTPGVNRGYQKGVLKDGRLANFTGACSPHIHEGVAMTTDMDGCALICEPVGNLVHRYRMSESDGRIVATPADGNRSFLTSTDERFRPVFATAGNDGAVYIADMYRGVVQHRMFMTTFLRKQVEERALEQPLDAGRIWRIVPKDGLQSDVVPKNLAKCSSEELVQLLTSTEKPVRALARRLLVERCDPKAVSLLRSVMLPTKSGLLGVAASTPVLESLWTLAGCGALDLETINAVFGSDQPVVRVHALRTAERALDSTTLAALLTRAIDDDYASVRVQALLSASALPEQLRTVILEAALRRDIASRAMRSAAVAVITGVETAVLDSIADGSLLADDGVGPRAFAAECTDALLDDTSGTPTPATLSHILATASKVAEQRPWLAKAMLERVAARQRLNAKEPVQLVASCEPEGWFAMLAKPPKDLSIATPIDRHLFWPGREDVAFIAPPLARAKEMSFEEFGKRLYSNCMSCHQANGRGLPPVYPPLRGSEIVLGEPSTLAKILLHGLEGKIEVDGQTYNQVMPAAPLRTDEEIAAVLSYVRSAWGNSAGAIDAAMVAKVREETKGRNRSMTARELGIEAN